MADTYDPYAPPGASLEPRNADGLWRDGKVLVLCPGSALPPRCIKCNAPAELPLRPRKLYWHQPWVYLLAVLNVLVYALVALLVRRRAVLAPGLCPLHRKRRWLGLAVGWGGSALALFLAFLGGTSADRGLMVLALAVLLGAIAAGILFARLLQPECIDDCFIRLKGCGRAFLDSLSEFRG